MTGKEQEDVWTTGAAERLDLVCLIVESAPPHPPQTLPQPNNVEGDAVVQGLQEQRCLVREPSAQWPHCTDSPLPPELATSPKNLYKAGWSPANLGVEIIRGVLLFDITICYVLL